MTEPVLFLNSAYVLFFSYVAMAMLLGKLTVYYFKFVYLLLNTYFYWWNKFFHSVERDIVGLTCDGFPGLGGYGCSLGCVPRGCGLCALRWIGLWGPGTS